MPGLIEMYAELKADVDALTAAMGGRDRVPEQRWATVTTCTASRIGVTFPGESVEQVVDRSTEAVWVGAQVVVQVQGPARWIVGLSGATIPAGVEAMFAGPTVPAGWLLRDGSLLSRATYWRLFAAIGTTWGVGDGSTTFALPNMAGKFDMGSGGGYSLGNFGGEATHLLTASEMPSHSHTIPNEDGQPPRRGAGASAGRIPGVTYASYTDASPTTGSAGGGAAHNNLPPYNTSLPIIKF